MSRYAPLVSLLIEHEFYGNPGDLPFVCTPDPVSIRLARNCEMVLKTHADGLSVYLDQQRTDALALAMNNPAAPAQLWFRLLPKDLGFANFTFPTTPRKGAVLFFSNDGSQPGGDDQRISLAKGKTASEEDFVKLDTPELADVITARDRRITPVAFICIALMDLTPRSYVLRFESRQTFWKYYLLGDMARPSATIVDTRGEMEFETGVETTLADDRRALSFTSKTQIPLRQHSDLHFQLRENGSGIDKVLIRRLPAASPEKLYKDTINGKEALVSDIYINC